MNCIYTNLQTGRRPTNNRNFGKGFSLFCVVAEEIWRHNLYRDDDDVLRNPCRPTGCRPNCSLSCVNNKLRKAINLIYLPRSNGIFDYMSILNGDKFVETVAGKEGLLCIFREAYWCTTSGQPWHTLALRDSSICVQLGIF